MIPRTLAHELSRLSEIFPVLTLTGPRQSGKSTLVRAVFPEHRYANLEHPQTRAFADNDPVGFLSELGGRAVIDEIQRTPDILSQIQVNVDEPGEARSYVLTGSQNLALANHVSQTLAGRTAVCTLLPFSHVELAAANRPAADALHWIIAGGYPRIFDTGMSPSDFHMSYVPTYLERDVRNVLSIGDLGRFQEFVQLCAGRTAQLLNYSSFASDLGVAVNTVKTWLSVLQATWVVHLLRPHHNNFSKRIIKSPKLYFVDTGLACALLGIRNPDTLKTHPLRGALFETAVVAELVKFYHNRYRRPPLFFWRDRSGHEVDCVIDDEGVLRPLEIKAGQSISDDFLSPLAHFRRLSGSSRGLVVYGGDVVQNRADADVVPWRAFTSWLESPDRTGRT